VRAAATEVARQRLFGLLSSWPGIALQQSMRRHHHSIGAVAALRGLLGDERGLNAVRLLRSSERFDGRDAVSGRLTYRRNAGANRAPVEDYRARATLPESTAEFRPMQIELVAKYVEQWLRGVP